MLEKFTIGFFSVVAIVAGIYLWEWLKEKFKMNGVIAAIISFVGIFFLMSFAGCIFDTNCKLF